MRHLNTVSGLVSVLGVAVLALGACNKSEETAAGKPAAATPAGAGGAQPAADAGPVRKAGLWEQTDTVPGVAGVNKARVCLGESVAPCPGAAITKTADGYSVSATCRMGATQIKMDGAAKGDLNSAYELNYTVTTSGPGAPASAKPTQVKTTLKWLEACPEGMKVGERQIAGGLTVDMSKFDPAKAAEMAKQAGK